MRCITITCNPAVDTTYFIDRLSIGEINRVREVRPVPGGKGNNVARVLASLGHPVVATGFAGGHTGRAIADGLTAAGVEPRFVQTAGESRRCIAVVEGEFGRITEIREPGDPVDERAATALLDRVVELAAEADVAVISGSLAPGLPADYYGQLIHALHAAGAIVALDSSGEALAAGLAAGPDLLKPNEEELAALVGSSPDATDAVRLARERILPKLAAAGRIVLSRGAAGAVSIAYGSAWSAVPPSVRIANTVGCGDALLAGYLDGRDRYPNEAEAVAHAVAVATASAIRDAIGEVDPDQIAQIRAQVVVERQPAPNVTDRTAAPEPTTGSTA